GRFDGVVLGLLADPDLPAELAERLAGELPELLAERLDDQGSWRIRVGGARFVSAAGAGGRGGQGRAPGGVGRGKVGIGCSPRPTAPDALAWGRSWPRPA